MNEKEGVMKQKKKSDFKPKKVKIVKVNKAQEPTIPRGDRFGKRWLPY